MKVIEFDARGQSLKMIKHVKPKMGTKGGYLVARFQLDGEYDDADIVIASFSGPAGDDEEAVQLDHGNSCAFPDGVTDLNAISVWLTCKTAAGATFSTNRVRVQQRR